MVSDRIESIFVAVTTYNRLEYVQVMAKSLSLSSEFEKCLVCVYDDCSDEYDEGTLARTFPFAKQIIRNQTNVGPGGNMRQAFESFLTSGCGVLVLADSDLLFHPSWIEVVELCHARTAGVLSLYNSVGHPASSRLEINGERILSKEHIGAAGTVFNRSVVRAILAGVPVSDQAYDWRWSRFLSERGIAIYTTERSYIQHIGAVGANSDGVYFDIGLGFVPGNSFNEMVATSFYDRLFAIRAESMEQYANARVEGFKKSDLRYRLGNGLMLPWDGLLWLARRVRRAIGYRKRGSRPA